MTQFSIHTSYLQFSQASKYGRVGAAKFVGGKPGWESKLGDGWKITRFLHPFTWWFWGCFLVGFALITWNDGNLGFGRCEGRKINWISDDFCPGRLTFQIISGVWELAEPSFATWYGRLQGTSLDLMPRHRSRFATLGSATAVPAHDYLTEVTAIELQPSVLQPNVPAVCKIWGQITFAPSPDP